MKFWWPHNEAIIATLLAYQLTGDEKYAAWHRHGPRLGVRHFPDPEYGEWFGYLHRDGRVHGAEGNMWKGPFHLPRMQTQVLAGARTDQGRAGRVNRATGASEAPVACVLTAIPWCQSIASHLALF